MTDVLTIVFDVSIFIPTSSGHSVLIDDIPMGSRYIHCSLWLWAMEHELPIDFMEVNLISMGMLMGGAL